MVLGFVFIITLGHFYCALLVLLLCSYSFYEVSYLAVEKTSRRTKQTIFWYFIALISSLKEHFSRLLLNVSDDTYRAMGFNLRLTNFVVKNLPYVEQHLSLCCYLLLLLAITHFVFGLRFSNLSSEVVAEVKTIFVAVIIVMQGVSQVKVINSGLIWFLVSTTCVIINDTMAYIFGCSFGKTSLMHISPNKTVEGFVGAIGATIIWSVAFGEFLVRYSVLTYSDVPFSLLPLWRNTQLPRELINPRFVWQSVSLFGRKIFFRHAWLDFFILGLVAAIFAPLGGFLASTFKRHLRIKDFGALIPGHGGITDRFDCQSIMAMFTWLYLRPIFAGATINYLIHQANAFSSQDRLRLIQALLRNLEPTELAQLSTLNPASSQ